ncbi:MAG TPA: hypothetical protein VJU86_14075 [Pyrinomonadaceae bacterium]|nr:hypothetical protein [Pyrinomonadaceae bacterium]
MSFRDRFKNLTHIAEACDLSILVWGPSEGVDAHYQKRLKIQREIRTYFRNADVVFSENLNLAESISGSERLTIPEQELWHLAACDVCVVLDTSKGAGEEIAHFVGSYLAHKLLILTHEKYEDSSSFPRAIRQNQNQLFYSDLQYESCSLVDAVLTRVRTVALGKLFRMRV